MNTLVSTIIPVFNRPLLLREAVGSVLAQTHRPIEIIIVDDGSTDGSTAETCASLRADNPDEIFVVRIANSGPGAARQVGLDVSTGAFIQFLDSDDLLDAKKFELQLTALSKNPKAGVSYGATRHQIGNEPPRNVAMRRTGEKIETMFPAHLKARWWSTSTPLFRRRILEAAGPWSPLRNEEDWEYECRVAKQGVRLAFVDAFVSTKRDFGSDQLSGSGSSDPQKLAHRAEAHRLILGHARVAGIKVEEPEMQHFARELFLLARQCGAAGLADEAKMLFLLSKGASIPERAAGLDFRTYELAAKVFGWRVVGRTSQMVDALRGRFVRHKLGVSRG